jgi:ribosomal protein L3 glutamine methyltransferase
LNVAEWVAHASSELERAPLHYGHGTDNANDEAAWLVLHAIGAELDGSFDRWQSSVSAEQANAIADLLKARLESRKPLAYLLGSAWFAGLEFEVNEDVLVPRSPIAELVLDQYSPWLHPGDLHRMLDLCTGSGCIGIASAVHIPGLAVDAADISPEALAVAARNSERHAVTERVRLVQSDLFEALAGERYDLIVSNPPYVAESGKDLMPEEYQAEPGLGLYSGADGLDLCLRIMLESANHLEEGGVLICEVGESADRLAVAMPQVPFLWLEFNSGGEGVFLLGKDILLQASADVEALVKERNRVG